MAPKRKLKRAAPKRKVAKKTGILSGRTFYYPPDASNLKDIKALVNEHDGVFTSVPLTAEFHLIPSGWSYKYNGSQGELIDVSFLSESIASGQLLDKSLYLVSELLPTPLAWQKRGEGRKLKPGVVMTSSPNRSQSPPRSPSPRPRARQTQNGPQSPARGNPEVPISPFKKRTLPWPRVGIDRYQDPIPLRGRELYTHDDDMAIVDFIQVNWNNARMSPNGNNLWRAAEAADIVPGRTWQSLQGRYKKTLRYKWGQLMQEHQRWAGR